MTATKWTIWCRFGGRGARWRLAAEAGTNEEATDIMFLMMHHSDAIGWLKVAPGRPTPDADPASQSPTRKGARRWV